MLNAFVVEEVNYLDETQCTQWIALLQEYAADPMGGGGLISQENIERLQTMVQGKHDHQPNLISFIGYENETPVAMTNCILSFSTFKAAPILNIHDFCVSASYRNKGFAQKLLQFVENYARQQGCCKLTLEVLEGNHPAKKAYLNFGFSGYELDPEMGKAVFWEKALTDNS